jgi:hypothetical protein
VFMFLCAFVASLCTMAYTLYKLMYFFVGIEGYSCETFKYVTGMYACAHTHIWCWYIYHKLTHFAYLVHLRMRAVRN